MVGLHFSETNKGWVFSQAVTPLGLALPIYTATAICTTAICGLPLWNPPGSGVIVEVISVDIDWASGTAAFSALGINAVPLTSVATGQPCSAFATTTPLNGLVGSGAASKCWSSNGASTVTVTAGTADQPTNNTPGLLRSIASINLEANTGTAQGTAGFTYGFNGTLLVPEGQMIYFVGTKATAALYASTLVWKEIPTR